MYVKGRFVPESEAVIPVTDRSFLFADGIYEVTAVIGGRLIDPDPHLARLSRSLGEIGIPNPHSDTEWLALQRELIARNALHEGLVYLQVSRGSADRDFWPADDLQPSVVMFTQAKPIVDTQSARQGVTIVTVPDLRWARRDIKSVSLLAQVLARRAAREAGAQDAWMVEDGLVTEAAAATAFIVTEAGALVTRPLSQAVLHGVTRAALLPITRDLELTFEERAFSVTEALAAREAFQSGAGGLVTSVVAIDGHPIGDGRPGRVAIRLRQAYLAHFGVG